MRNCKILMKIGEQIIKSPFGGAPVNFGSCKKKKKQAVIVKTTADTLGASLTLSIELGLSVGNFKR